MRQADAFFAVLHVSFWNISTSINFCATRWSLLCIPQMYSTNIHTYIYICYSELEVLPAWTKATRRLKSTSRPTLQMLLLLWTMAAASDERLQKLLKQSLLTNSWVCEGSRRRVRGSTEGRKVRGKQAGERGMVGGTRCAQDFLDSVDLVNTSSRGPTHSTTPVT